MTPATGSSSLPATMKAWQYGNKKGGLDNLKLNPAATPPKPPKAGSDEVLVEVISMALNPLDYKLASLLTRFFIQKLASPGLDFSGRVAALPEGMKEDPQHPHLKVGQLVFGKLDWPYQCGTLGQFTKAIRSGVAPLPDRVDVDQAAAIASAGLTAYQSVAPHVKKGSRVFINGGSGGVGTFTVQVAKVLGCHVTTTCSAVNIELCKGLGADEVIDYTKCDIAETLKGKGKVFDLVVDNVGKQFGLYKASDHFLGGENGKKAPFVQVAVSDEYFRGVLAMLKSCLLPSFLGGGKHPWRFFMVKNNLDELVRIGEWVKEGKIRVVLDETFEFESAPEAYKKLKLRRARGKIVVNVTERPAVKS